MSAQSKLGSMIEASVNIIIGFTINLVMNVIIFPWFGYPVTFGPAFKIGLIFTVISVARQYILRRLFNHRLHKWSETLATRINDYLLRSLP